MVNKLKKLNKNLSIDNVIPILKGTSIVFSVLSVFFLIASFSRLEWSEKFDFNETVSSIYGAVAHYSGIYQFTLVVIGLLVTLARLKLSLNNDTTRKEIEELNKTINNKNLEIIKLESEIRALKSDLVNIQYENEKFVSDKKELDSKLSRMSRENNSFSVEYSELKKRQDDLKEEIYSIQEIVSSTPTYGR